MTENKPTSPKKNSNYFYLISFALIAIAVGLTWTSWSERETGIFDILPCVWNTATETLASQGLSIFAFAFFLYAILESKAFEALFASQRKWLEKRKYFTIGLITVVVALLSASLSWFDEFVHFYPLIIPLFLVMGFDFFSSFLCLYGGSIAGLIGLVSPERMGKHLERCGVSKVTKFTGLSGSGLRLLFFALFTAIIVLFNIWYCSRIQQKKAINDDDLTKEKISYPFNRTHKFILAVAGFFLFVSILGQYTPFSEKIEKSKITEDLSPKLTNDYEKTEYKKQGEIGSMKIGKEVTRKEGYWDKFGSWSARSLDCWFIIGGIIICLLAKLNLAETFITAAQNSLPLVFVYILAAVPAEIIKGSGFSNNLAKWILPKNNAPDTGPWLLLVVFGLSTLISFFICSTSITAALVSVLVPTLLAISSQTLIYAGIFSWIGGILGMVFSPANGILVASLERSKTSYKQFIKKTWVLWLTMTMVTFGLIFCWARFIIK